MPEETEDEMEKPKTEKKQPVQKRKNIVDYLNNNPKGNKQ